MEKFVFSNSAKTTISISLQTVKSFCTFVASKRFIRHKQIVTVFATVFEIEAPDPVVKDLISYKIMKRFDKKARLISNGTETTIFVKYPIFRKAQPFFFRVLQINEHLPVSCCSELINKRQKKLGISILELMKTTKLARQQRKHFVENLTVVRVTRRDA